MPNYAKLSLSTGGGVVNAIQQAQQAPGATVAIGIGGTGCSCLKQLKLSVHNRIRPDDVNAPNPEYSHIRYLAVDTDKSSVQGSGSIGDLDSVQEFYDLDVPDANRVLQANQGTPGFEWLNDDIRVMTGGSGANGVRQIGRMLLLTKVTGFINRLKTIISAAMTGTSPNVNVFIFAGIGGGTGAGMFLDVCYLVQHVLEEMGVTNKRICAFAFLPDVNLSRVADPAMRTNIQVNGYCSMREIDYCMNLLESGSSWKQELGNGRNKIFRTKPADIVQLVTATDATGAIKANAYEYAMNVVCDFVMDFIAENESDFTLASHISNLNTATDQVTRKYGANYDYCVLGAACAEIPFKDILTYLAGGLYENFLPVFNRNAPSDAEMKEFIKLVKFGYEDLKRAYDEGANRIDILPPAFEEYPDEFKAGGNAHLIGRLNEQYDKREGIRSQNRSAMTEKITQFSYDNAPPLTAKSVCARIYGALLQVAADASRGPVYAQAMLRGVIETDLHNILEGYITRAQEEIVSEAVNHELRTQEADSAKAAFPNAGALTKKGKYKAYAAAAQNYYNHLSKQSMLEGFAACLKEIQSELNKLPVKFRMLSEIIAELRRVFDDNYQALRSGKTFGFADSTYCVKLMTVQELQKQLDEKIQNMPSDVYFNEMIVLLLNHQDIWEADERVATLVSKYFAGVFNDYANKSMNEYLQDKFQIYGDQARLINEIYTQILMPLKNTAAPMFWLNSVFDMSENSAVGYCSGPDSCSAIMSAAQRFTTDFPLYAQRRSKLNDRITVLSFYSGLPMMAYQGLKQYKTEYLAHTKPGQYSHETDCDWSAELPHPAAYSFSQTDNSLTDSEIKNAAVLQTLYDKAMQAGILKTKTGADGFADPALYLEKPDFRQVEQKLGELENLAAAGRQDEAKTLAAEIEKSLNELPSENEMRIFVKAHPNYTDRVRFDNFIRYNPVHETAQQELERWNAFNEKFTAAKRKLDAAQSRQMTGETFKKACAAGIVQFDRVPVVTFSVEDPEDYSSYDGELSKASMPFGHIPLYQAFLSFQELPAEQIAVIDRIASARMDDADQMRAALKIAATYMCAENVAKWKKAADTFYKPKKAEIIPLISAVAEYVTQLNDLY